MNIVCRIMNRFSRSKLFLNDSFSWVSKVSTIKFEIVLFSMKNVCVVESIRIF